jgi:hypothetical protein
MRLFIKNIFLEACVQCVMRDEATYIESIIVNEFTQYLLFYL